MPFIAAIAVLGAAVGGAALAPAIFVPLLTSAIGQMIIFSSLARVGMGVLGALLPKPKSPGAFISDHQAAQDTVRDTMKARDFVVGKTRRGGTLTFYERVAGSPAYIHMVVTFTGHEIQSFEQLLMGDEVVPVDGSGAATGAHAGFLNAEFNLGTETQSAFAGLVAALPAKWTSNHRQRGCAGVYIKVKDDSAHWTNGIPAPRATMKGAKCFDPRTSTTAWTDNPALIARWFLTLPVRKGGWGMDAAMIDDSLVSAAANICDETVELNAGGTVKRYTCNGSWDQSADKKQVLMGILRCMAGDAVFVGGKWRIYAGAWLGSSESVTQGDFRDEIAVSSLPSLTESFNGVKGRYVSPDFDYQATDYPTYRKAKYIAIDNGYDSAIEKGNWATSTAYVLNDAVMHKGSAYICIAGHTSGASTEPGVGASWTTNWALCALQTIEDLDLPFVDHWNQAERVAKIFLEAHRRPVRVTAPLKLTKFNLCIPDVFQLTFPDFDWTNKLFKVRQSRLSAQQASRQKVIFGVDIEAQETDSAIFAWDKTKDEIIPGAQQS